MRVCMYMIYYSSQKSTVDVVVFEDNHVGYRYGRVSPWKHRPDLRVPIRCIGPEVQHAHCVPVELRYLHEKRVMFIFRSSVLKGRCS